MIEERRVSILSVPGLLWSLGRKVEDLLALQRTVRESRDAVDSRLRALEDRMTYLEAHQERPRWRSAIGCERGLNRGCRSRDL
jgi:hypothetical protein